jgi:hypothetical protein
MPVVDVAPMPPKADVFPATGITMIRTPAGWSLVKLNLRFTPGQQCELVDWSVLGDDGPVPHSHACNAIRVFVARQFLHPELAADEG